MPKPSAKPVRRRATTKTPTKGRADLARLLLTVRPRYCYQNSLFCGRTAAEPCSFDRFGALLCGVMRAQQHSLCGYAH